MQPDVVNFEERRVFDFEFVLKEEVICVPDFFKVFISEFLFLFVVKDFVFVVNVDFLLFDL